MENFRDAELKKWLAEEYEKETEEMEKILFPDGVIPDDGETEEEAKAAYQRLVEKLKADGVYKEDETDSIKTDDHKENVKIVYLPEKKSHKAARVAAAVLVCSAGIFAASMTSQANRSYFLDSVRYWVGDDTSISIENDESEKEYEDENNLKLDINLLSKEIYKFTSGYPFLVSRICEIIDEKIIPNRDEAWTKEDIQRSIKILLEENNTLFDDLIKNMENNKELYQLEVLKNELTKVLEEKEEAAQADSTEDYQKAAELKTKECALTEQINDLSKKVKLKNLTVQDIAEVIENWTKIPVKKITEAETQKLLNLENNLHQRVVGQDEAVEAVSRAIRRNRAGLKSTKRPPSFIFVGPTGVGKTELAKSLAYEMFGNEDSIIRIDMSEYMESHSTSKLIGSPPGYVGYDDAGQLTEKVKRNPYSIVLLDEIEKAHPDVFNILLQVLDDGRLTDSQGNTVSFENTIIIMTSNAGSNLNTNSIGFGITPANQSKMMDALKETFRPEFLNRVDEIVVFNQLTQPQLIKIIDLMLDDTRKSLEDKNISIEISDEAKKYILNKGTDIKYGARPLRRAIQRYLEDELSDMILRSELTSGKKVCVNSDGNCLNFEITD